VNGPLTTTSSFQSAVSIAADVTAGRVPARDVLATSLQRHHADAVRLNALTQGRWSEAERDARAIDDRVAAGAIGTAPLAGVPISVKECFAVRGCVTTLGIPSREACVDTEDAVIVSRLRHAGAIVIGKANVPQAMYLHETSNPVWGTTRHPFDLNRSPGGSSGGDAALVAAGVVPLAVGNDLAGSLRQPAHACGIASIMPRTSVLGDGGAFNTMPSLRGVRSRAGFLARDVDDLALAAMAVGVTTTAEAGRPRRIAWWDDANPIPPSPAVRRGVRDAVSRLAATGIETVQVSADVATTAAWVLLGMLSADGGDDIRRLFAGTRPMPDVARLLAIAGVAPSVRPAMALALRCIGRQVESEAIVHTGRRSSAEFDDLMKARAECAERFASIVEGCDAVVCPVSSLPALPHGAAARLVLAASPCLLANLLDLPAGAVPVTTVGRDEARTRSWSLDPVLRAAAAADRGSAGLPIGVQVIGCPGATEGTVLATMRLIAAHGVVSRP